MQLHRIYLVSFVTLLFTVDVALAAGGGSASSAGGGGGGSGRGPAGVGAGVAAGGGVGHSPMARHAAALSATVTELNGVSQDSPLRPVLHAILEKKSPKLEDIKILERMTAEGRRRYMRTQLEALVSKGVVESTETHMVPGDGPLGLRVHAPAPGDTNAQITRLLASYGLPAYTDTFPDNMYQSLDYALRTIGEANPVVPQYVMATQEELAVVMGDPVQKASIQGYFAANPGVTLVLKVGSSNTLNLTRPNIPESLRSLSIVGGEHVTTIGDGFLTNFYELTTIDLRSLTKVTTIGDNFLFGCRKLTTLDLSPLSKVTTIGAYFLWGCHGLTTLDLSPFSKVTTIRDYFLCNCYRLDPATQAAVEKFKAEVAARAAWHRPAGVGAGVAAGVAAGR